MLYSAMELITLAASNSHIVFCFCHFIIALLILLVTASPSSSSSSSPFRQSSSHSFVEETTRANDTHETESVTHNYAMDQKNEELVECVETETATELIDDNVESTCEEEENVEEEDDDDELRRRAEEFIEKVNRGWKAEKLRNNYNAAGTRSWSNTTHVGYSVLSPA